MGQTFNDDKWENEQRGLLLIDGLYNTLMIPFGSDEMNDLMEYLKGGLKYVRKNKLKRDLNKSINEYLNKEYVNKERD